MVISDFGLCRKLELDESSFLLSVRGGGGHNAPGSFGYRAPEVLRGEVDANELVNTSESGSGSGSTSQEATNMSDGATSNPTSSTSTALLASNGRKGVAKGQRKLTRSIDIFSLGCIFYFVLTGGDHPFGVKYEREINILNDKINVEGLSIMGNGIYEAQTLVQRMCHADAHER